jgi:DnaJ domain
MKSKVKTVAANEILHFINERPISVLRAGNGLEFEFNMLLSDQLQTKYHNAIGMGRIDISKIDLSQEPYRFFYHAWMKSLGLQKQASVLPGYYIFADGGIVGYHPGTLEPTEFDDKLTAVSQVAGLIAGLLVGIVEKSFEKGLRAFITAIEAPQALKILKFIEEVLGNRGTKEKTKRQTEVVKSELEKAYALLGVKSTATDEEVQKARRMMMKKYHPDLHPSETEKYNRISSEINNAFDFIMQARKKA